MPYCTECGSEVDAASSYCRACGAPQGEDAPDSDYSTQPITWVCKQCGTKAQRNKTPCNECGGFEYAKINATIDDAVASKTDSGSPPSPDGVRTDLYYELTLALSGTWLFAILLWLTTSSVTYNWLALIGIIASTLTMYLDLSQINSEQWDTSKTAWALGALFLWVVVMPVYLYKRSRLD
ncbi:double zinc ribbon domain-containing protein [Haloarcula argentinensis]|uniref:double zinc ribbon domain-containing protein n=1 Tax=Haloarcula argentinensis TaxID=43776 RepID=UPI003D663794